MFICKIWLVGICGYVVSSVDASSWISNYTTDSVPVMLLFTSYSVYKTNQTQIEKVDCPQRTYTCLIQMQQLSQKGLPLLLYTEHVTTPSEMTLVKVIFHLTLVYKSAQVTGDNNAKLKYL